MAEEIMTTSDVTALRAAELSEAKRALLEKWRRGQLKATAAETRAIPRRSEPGAAPLSFAQQRLWFLEQLVPGNPFYNEHVTIPMPPPLNVAVLEKTLNEIIRRHETLRTTFEAVNGSPRQIIAPALELKIPVIDLSRLPEQERMAEALRLATEQAQRPFDLLRGPLLRVSILRTDEENHLFALTMHHIIADGWSMDVFYRELNELYMAFSAGRHSPLPELPIQYADFAVWQREYLTGEVLEKQLGYWKKQLIDLPTLNLPTDRPRPAMQSFRGATVPLMISKRVQKSVQALCGQEEATPFMVLLTAFEVLLSRYTNQEDIVVGSPIANRNRAELEPLIGFFVNMLVMRGDLSGDPSFREAVRRVKQVCLEAYAHQDLPFEKLVEELQPERDLSRNPLFQVIFQFFSMPGGYDERETDEETITETSSGFVDVKNTVAKFDLRLDLWDTAEGIGGQLEYSRDLFDEATIKRMAAHFQMLLEAVAENPEQRLSQLPLLTNAEQHQLLVEWNETKSNYSREACVHHLFEAQAENTPDSVAVVFAEQQLTYKELNDKANQLAHHLRSLSVRPEVTVGVCMERSLEMIVGLLGILKAGGAYVPLDPQYPKERLSFMVNDAGVRVLLTQQKLRGSLPVDSGTHVVSLDSDWELIAREPKRNLESNANADNLAYVIYTSGSTGQPKGLGAVHRGVVRLVKETNYADFGAKEVFLQFAPLSFDASTFEIWGALLNGARLAIFPAHSSSLDELGETLRRYEVTTLWLTAGLFHQIVESRPEDLARLRHLLTGGDVVSAPHVEKALRTLQSEEARLTNGYGPTENTTFTSYFTMTKRSEVGASIPIGRPVANTQVYVLDRYMRPVPVSVPGELYIGGDGLARGYLNRPEMTAEKFVPHPFSREAGQRLYRTGDMVRYRADGQIEFLGRNDNQVKVRGFRIELGEVEAALSQHAAINEAVVVARENGSAGKSLIAYVVARGEQSPTASELYRFMREKLPAYMTPSAFVMLDQLPLTPNGKIDRRALPQPDAKRPKLDEVYAAPGTFAEELLAKIWANVLGLERVGIHDNFFELGGDSILTIQITARANQAGLRLTPKQVFQHQTIAELAAVSGTAPTIEAEQGFVMGQAPLTPVQHWFFEQNLSEPHHFNQSILLEVPQSWHFSLLKKALEKLLAHHDALRFRYRRDESGWQQFHADADEHLAFSRLDLSALEEEEQTIAIETAAAEMQASLNLLEGPILRAALFEMGGTKANRLFIVIHHLAVDGVSWRILTEDLQTACDQLRAGESIELPPKTTSFKRWAERLVEHAQSAAFRRELPYWQSLSRNEQHLHIPRDLPGGENTVATIDEVFVSLSDEETRALLQDVPAAYHTQINDALLTALVQSFTKWTGAKSLLLNLEGHGREPISDDLDVSRTVGWFTTIFPILLEINDSSSPGAALKSIKEQLRAIPNRGIGYGLLRYLSNDAEIITQLRSLPRAEVSFNYLGQFGQSAPETVEGFETAQESSGPLSNPRGARMQLLEIDGSVENNELIFIWTYSKNFHQRSTIETLAANFMDALRSLISHCQSPEAGGYTPSDFSRARLNQSDLDRLLSKLGQSKA
jgi:amino acid adenylation domain-containing protein/non-ribosomal peptide synthase protein (TIGR01720 family)